MKYSVVNPHTKDECPPFATYAEAKKFALTLSRRYGTATEIKRYPTPYSVVKLILAM